MVTDLLSTSLHSYSQSFICQKRENTGNTVGMNLIASIYFFFFKFRYCDNIIIVNLIGQSYNEVKI